MTKREFLQAVIEGNYTDEIVAFAEHQIELLAKPKKPTKAQVENELLLPRVEELLSEEPVIAHQVMEALDLSSPQKATSLLGKLVKAGVAEKVKVRVDGKDKVGYVRVEEAQ